MLLTIKYCKVDKDWSGKVGQQWRYLILARSTRKEAGKGYSIAYETLSNTSEWNNLLHISNFHSSDWAQKGQSCLISIISTILSKSHDRTGRHVLAAKTSFSVHIFNRWLLLEMQQLPPIDFWLRYRRISRLRYWAPPFHLASHAGTCTNELLECLHWKRSGQSDVSCAKPHAIAPVSWKHKLLQSLFLWIRIIEFLLS